MKHFWTILIALAAAAAGSGQGTGSAPAKSAPAIDRQKLESYLRFAEGFSPSVKFVLDDPVATPIPGFYRLPVHLSMGETKQDKTYYLTADGQHIVGSPVWDLNKSPFIAVADKLTTGGPSFGPANAKVTIVVFSDFECPYCREFARTVRDNIPQKYPKEVRVVFKDFPLDAIHPWARAAAEASHCMSDGRPDVFWAYHDWIFQHQGEITAGNLKEKVLGFAKEHALDSQKVASCVDNHSTKDEVESNVKKGREIEVEQTPTFFLNGRMVSGAVAWGSLNTLIQMEINRPAVVPELQSTK